MTTYKFGEVVLVEFLYSDQSKRKKRPALVVLDIGDDDVVLAPITSQKRSGKGDCRISNWEKSGLLKESWVRLSKIASLEKSDIIKCLGKLSSADKNNIVKSWQELYALEKGN